MTTQYYCKSEKRRALVRDTLGPDDRPVLNGIDYLEVSADQLSLYVHFIHNLPGQVDGFPDSPVLSSGNLSIDGGVRIRDIRVLSISAAGNVLTVNVDRSGDFSTYRLRLSRSSTSDDEPDGFDPQLAGVDFSFKVDCPNDFDCAPDDACPPEPLGPEPVIDYLAKDYASFRRLMSDRLSVVIPDWTERNGADLGVAVVEAVAYVADYLSYYQDAVGNEAYLGTARRRVSVRRHARILDYHMHQGCNSRVWVQVQLTSNSNVPLPAGTQLLTRVEGPPALEAGTIQHEQARSQNPAVFETQHDTLLHEPHNQIHFYTWSDEECCLPRGATRATLRDQEDDNQRLLLRPGDVLIFEEIRGTSDNDVVDPTHRHAVRLTSVSPQATQPVAGQRIPGAHRRDPLTGDPVVEIEWDLPDELPFPLCLSTQEAPEVAVARGNIVLASHGDTIAGEEVEVPQRARHWPALAEPNVTYSQDYDHEDATSRPAAGLLEQDPRQALPEVTLELDGATWIPRRDLLNSGRSSAHFVAETEDDGVSYLRFGDGVLGRQPASGARFQAAYRVGNGRSGNVGAEAIYHIVTSDPGLFARVRNPLAARGGIDPEPIQQVKLYAPQAFRTQERAVTEEDYAEVARRHREVQQAVATRRWTGSWHTMFITVDRREGRPVDADFEDELREFIEKYRLAGHDLEIEPPLLVPLDIEMTVCVLPEYFRGVVKEALLETFSNQTLPSGASGFWHPDNFTFGQTVYLSRIVAAAMEVPGVMWVEVTKFQRWGKPDLGERNDGRINLGRLEIAQLDNDPSQPENGKMEFHLEGGL